MTPNKPKIVCLCGSTRFKDLFIKYNFEFTMKGFIVLSVGWFSHADSDIYYPTEEEKEMLNDLHKRKIDLADKVFVINPGQYIGKSTLSEIKYAKSLNKPIFYMESYDTK